jgi:DNA-binding MarR family transcriptional regulator
MKPQRTIRLKPRQMAVFEATRELTAVLGTTPTAQQIADHLHIRADLAQRALDKLVEKGVLRRNKGATLQ